MKYSGDFLKEISFPIGGIGTGSIGLGGDGRLIDWEIFNRPSKGSINGFSHFAIRAITDNKIIPAVLNGDISKEYTGQYQKMTYKGFGHGPSNQKMIGFPHFEEVEFDGEFPVAKINFKSREFPGNVTLTAFNPFIPCDAKNSSIPAAFFEIEVENTKDEETKYQVAFSVGNPFAQSSNQHSKKDDINLITMYNKAAEFDDVKYGDLSVASDGDTTYWQTYWYRGENQDNIVSFWNDFATSAEFKDRLYDSEGKYDTCTILSEIVVLPKSKKSVRFVLSWNIPNNCNYWTRPDRIDVPNLWKNYYATVFGNSVDSAVYSLKNWDDLYNRTVLFKESLYSTTMPEQVIDAAASNLSVLKSPTVLRLEDGSFYGWEGVNENVGSCEGTCQHVWNYAYAMCFLFPELERSIRDMEFKYSMDTDGRMPFRIMLPLGREMLDFRACLDGQMGTVIKCYREWKISGDSDWLRANWNNIKNALEYAWSDKNPDCWDLNKDGVLEGRQHHTLDSELFGPSSWLMGMYLGALKAASEMAEFLDDTDKANEYADVYIKGREWMKNNLFSGKHFVQKIDLSDKNLTDKYGASQDYWNEETKQIKYQISEGSSIDQMLAQWHADIIGLGDIFDASQVETALDEMMKNNYKPTMRHFANPWRIFSVNDEAGSVICDYPDGVQKPSIPIPYCEETMTGFEYSFAGLLCSRGKLVDGFKVVSAVRNRFDGAKRNPWNEFECGSNYARSMASYALIPILSGFRFDIPRGYIGFNPYKKADFKSFWSVGGAWGVFESHIDCISIKMYGGSLVLKTVGVSFCESVQRLEVDGRERNFTFKDGKITFEKAEISNGINIYL